MFGQFYTKKNIAVIKKILGNEINIFFDVGAHKCETVNLFNKHFKIKKKFLLLKLI